MTFYILLFVLLLITIYLGQVVGMMIHCELSSEIKELKGYVYLIPFLRIAMFFYCLQDCIKDKDWKFFVSYILCPDKNIMFMCALIESLPEIKRMRREREIKRKLRNSPIAMIKCILFETEDIIQYRREYM